MSLTQTAAVVEDPPDPAAEILRDRARIERNHLLREIYLDAYRRLLAEVPEAEFPRVVEIGSGGGFLKEVAPRVMTTDCVAAPLIDRVVDACRMADSFADGELDGVLAFNVFHHLPDPTGFLRGAARVLRPGGRIVLVEPWFTPVGRLFHEVLHHEPAVSDPDYWGVVGSGRMAGANSRLPTSVFLDGERRLREELPELRIVKRDPFHKWLYLLSGGLRLNTRLPAALARLLVGLDRGVRAGDALLGLFALVVVERVPTTP